jgi:hypothetical protein
MSWLSGPGAAVGFAINSGRMAGERALKYHRRQIRMKTISNYPVNWPIRTKKNVTEKAWHHLHLAFDSFIQCH